MINKLTVKDATVVYLKANTSDSEGKSVAIEDNPGPNGLSVFDNITISSLCCTKNLELLSNIRHGRLLTTFKYHMIFYM